MKILVVVDEQKDFTTGVLGNAECEATVQEVIPVINDGDYDRIYFTQDTHHEDYMNTQEGRKLPVEHCFENTDGWMIVPEILDAAKAKGAVIEYITKPSFGSLALAEKLQALNKQNGIEKITFCGVCTGICVISNVLIAKAACPEVPVEVIESACACVTPDTHKTAIEAMKTCQVDIV